MTTTTIFAEGDLVRLTRDITEYDGSKRSKGFEAVVEQHVTAEESEDGVAFYWASAIGGMNNITFPADAAQLVWSSAEMADRKLPSIKTLRNLVAGATCGADHNGLSIDETDNDGEQAFEAYDITAEGLRFGFEVVVRNVTHTDF